EGLVEAPGLDIAGSDLQDDARRPATAVVLQERAEEVAGDALAAPGRVDGEVGHVDLARDRPHAEVSHDGPGLARDGAIRPADPQVRDAVLLQLVEERPPRPWARERRALDLDDGVEVRGPHRLNADRRHAGAAPGRARLRTAGHSGERATRGRPPPRGPGRAARGRRRSRPTAGGIPEAPATRPRRGRLGAGPRAARRRRPRRRSDPPDPGPAPRPGLRG